MAKYYRLVHQYKGHHYFKVSGFNKVTKVTIGNSAKTGRPYCVGITLIMYNTYISSYAHWIDHKDNVFIEISQEEYESAFEIVLSKLK